MGPTWLDLLFSAGDSVGCVVTLADSRSFSCPSTLRCVRDEMYPDQRGAATSRTNQLPAHRCLPATKRLRHHGLSTVDQPFTAVATARHCSWHLCEAPICVARNNVFASAANYFWRDGLRKDSFRRSTAPSSLVTTWSR